VSVTDGRTDIIISNSTFHYTVQPKTLVVGTTKQKMSIVCNEYLQ